MPRQHCRASLTMFKNLSRQTLSWFEKAGPEILKKLEKFENFKKFKTIKKLKIARF